jgi:hypothetical protein
MKLSKRCKSGCQKKDYDELREIIKFRIGYSLAKDIGENHSQ